MSMKKADLEKHLAKKLDGRMKTSAVPQRFGKGSGAAKPDEKAHPAVARLVPLSCRLPADLVNRVREQAIGREGGMSALVAQALAQWLESANTNAKP